jgi:aspartyl protease family protein
VAVLLICSQAWHRHARGLAIGVASALVACVGAHAQTVTFNGRMGDRALLVIDGQPRTVGTGTTVQGVRLLGLDGDDAKVEFGGKTVVLHQGAPVNLGRAESAGAGREIVLPAGPGGHFLAEGSINGRATRFMVDTGATMVALSAAEADRLGVDYKRSPAGYVNTANGSTLAYHVMLDSVRIGDVQVYNVDAVVVQAPLDRVLLGNTFLSHFQMTRDNDVMRLEKR